LIGSWQDSSFRSIHRILSLEKLPNQAQHGDDRSMPAIAIRTAERRCVVLPIQLTDRNQAENASMLGCSG